MKMLFTLVFAALFATACCGQTHYISSNTKIIVIAGSTEKFDSPDIFCMGYYDVLTGDYKVTVMVAPAGTTEIVKSFDIIIAYASVDDEFGGFDASEDFILSLDLAVVNDYLQPLNVSTTFTSH
jgi:hypothetical protein